MPKITNVKQAKIVLKQHDFHFQKKYGQNFLLDISILDEIATAAGVTGQDYVVEIGPGMGSLTARLAARAKAVLAIEIDGNLLPVLEETLGDYDNVRVWHGDVMKIDLGSVIRAFTSGKWDENNGSILLTDETTKNEYLEIAENTGVSADEIPSVKFVANLPYYITTPVIMKLLEEGVSYNSASNSDKRNKFCFESITVMVQKEVAERMLAKPGTKAYGALSLAVQYASEPSIVRYVSAGCFYPPPKVDSAVVSLSSREKPPAAIPDERLFFSLIRASFNQRRKTLANGLANGSGLPFTKTDWQEMMEALGFGANIRGEQLSLEDFAALSRLAAERLLIWEEG